MTAALERCAQELVRIRQLLESKRGGANVLHDIAEAVGDMLGAKIIGR